MSPVRRPSLRWQERALCVGDDPDLYYDDAGPQCCGTCPVRTDCLEFALLTDERYGVWGGAGEETRRILAKAVGVMSAREVAAYYTRTGRPVPRKLARR